MSKEIVIFDLFVLMLPSTAKERNLNRDDCITCYHSSSGVEMENNVKVNCSHLVFLLIWSGIFTLIFSGVNSSEFNINGEFLF